MSFTASNMSINKLAYFKFVTLNFIIIAGILFCFPPNGSVAFFSSSLPVLSIVLLCQYPLLARLQSWISRCGIFLLGMFFFLFLFGVVNTWNEPAGGAPAGSLIARLDGGLVMLIFGTIFGVWFYPLIVLINWLARRQLFPSVRNNITT